MRIFLFATLLIPLMIVTVTNRQSDLKISSVQVKKIVSYLLTHEGITCDEVSVFLVTTKVICRLHEEFFNDKTPTDCISFPIDEIGQDLSTSLLGEIFICPKTAINFAAKHQKDPYEETTLYIVHALLHLLGYDDMEPKAKAKMRRKEASLMKKLKIARLQLSSRILNKKSVITSV